MFNTPILFIIFNRPDTTQCTFEGIKKVRPKHLYIAADGPRSDKPMDKERCQATRSIIDQIDWPCNLYTLFKEENRGCGHGPAEAITWFFEHVEKGIILEDDCVPHPSFFPYCETLLEKYENNIDIYMITGTNVFEKWHPNRSSYFFSYLGNSYGWASWRRAWKTFDYEMKAWSLPSGKEKIKSTLKNKAYYNHFQLEFTRYHLSQPDDVWDFQWAFARWLNSGKTIVPSVNLISNIGFNADATHTLYEHDLMAELPLSSLSFPLVHPVEKIDSFFDWYFFEKYINPARRNFAKKVLLKAVRLLIN